METRRLWFAVLVVALFAPGPSPPTAATEQNAGAASNQGGVVFVGSSIFHRWINLKSQMAPLPIVNRAVDGTRTSDMLRMVDAVVRERPKVVAYYCGSNDIDAGEPAAAIFDRIRQFVVRITTALPQAHVVFVSINRAPEKQERWDVVDAVNRLVEVYATQTKHLRYVDVNPVLFNRDGTPRIDLYLSDQLHLRPAAYEEFARVLKPVLTNAFEMP
jgi:lysophospholipase L1-like esterase